MAILPDKYILVNYIFWKKKTKRISSTNESKVNKN